MSFLNEYLVPPLEEWLSTEFLNQPILLSSIEFYKDDIEPMIIYADMLYVYFYHFGHNCIKRYNIYDSSSSKIIHTFFQHDYYFPVLHCYQYQNLIGFKMFDGLSEEIKLVLIDVTTGNTVHFWKCIDREMFKCNTLQMWDCEKEILFDADVSRKKTTCRTLSLSSSTIGSKILSTNVISHIPFYITSIIIQPNSSIHIFEYDWNKTNEDKFITQCPNKITLYHNIPEFGQPINIIANNIIYSDLTKQIYHIFQLPV